MKILSIIIISFFVVATFSLMRAASKADNHTETIRISKEEK